MKLRKINAGLSLLTTVLLMDHAIFFSGWMLSRCAIAKSAENLPWLLAGLTVLHAALSLLLAVLGRKGAKKARSYPKQNIPTMVQRITGLLMLFLLGLHIAGAASHFQPKMLHALLHPLFFAAALAHVSVSASKSMITLGIGSAKIIKLVDTVMKCLCAATFVSGVIGFYLCLFLGVAR